MSDTGGWQPAELAEPAGRVGTALAGKVVVVTGAAQGQGAAQAAAFVAEGATVIALDIQPADGVRAHDVASEQDWAVLRDDLAAEFGEVHGLVNNAGITHRARLCDVQLVDLQRVLAVNLAGPLLGIHAMARLMTGGGPIVNIGSVAGLTAHYPVAYTASKWALRGLSQVAAMELGAAKLHLKHIATATTEGYASRPGGAQAELLAEVNKHEAERNLDLVLAEFRNYQQGIMPAGPAARELTEFFTHVDGKLALADAAAPKTQRSDREVLNLLTKRAQTLHLGAANYCWFTDPSRALCLKLAGTPHADRPLAGMCDSARCPQATHHPCHRPVWAEHAEQTKTFLGSLGPSRKIERARLRADHDRALRVLDAIDTAANPNTKA
jgi:NAD(P)-dependent dehydrogenase (short-subunit alcohol dehydrogenase family)